MHTYKRIEIGSASDPFDSAAQIVAEDGTDNYIVAFPQTDEINSAVYAYGNLSIGKTASAGQTTGSITISNYDNASQDLYCVYATGTATVNGGKLNLEAASPSGTNSSYGLYGETAVDVTKGIVNVTAGTEAGLNHSVYGIYSKGTISIGTEGATSNNEVSLNITANPAQINSVGIYLESDTGKAVTINSGIVNIKANGFLVGAGNNIANCVYSGGAINLVGGNITLNATGQDDNNCALHAAGNGKIINMDVSSFEIEN